MTYSLVDASVTEIVFPRMGYYLDDKFVGRPDIVVTLDLQGSRRKLIFSQYRDNPTRHGLSSASRAKVAVHDESRRIAGIVYEDFGFIPDYVYPEKTI